MTEDEYQEQIAAKNQSLRRAWTVLQVVRNLVEMSRGKPLDRPEEKSFDEEGRIICQALGEELADLHTKMNKAVLTADQAWNFEDNRLTTVQRDVIGSRDYPRLDHMAIFRLTSCARHMATEPPRPIEPKEAE